MVRVEHQPEAMACERPEILVAVQPLQAENLLVEWHTAFDGVDDEIQAHAPQAASVDVRGLPGIALAQLGHTPHLLVCGSMALARTRRPVSPP
jgi:hypothetical protein